MVLIWSQTIKSRFRNRSYCFTTTSYTNSVKQRETRMWNGFPCDDLRKIFCGCQQMAKVPNAVEILRKISTVSFSLQATILLNLILILSRVHERYRRQTTDRQTDWQQHIANVNMSSRSLKL